MNRINSKKNAVSIFLILVLFFFTGCLGSESGDTNELGDLNDLLDGTNDSDQYKFVDQDLKGYHSDVVWEMLSGRARNSFDDSEWELEFYNVNPATPGPFDLGAYTSLDYLKLSIDIPKDIVGVKKLKFSFGGTDNFYANFYNTYTNLNCITGSGAVEILSVDSANKNITGRLDIWYTDSFDNLKYHITGNFTVPHE